MVNTKSVDQTRKNWEAGISKAAANYAQGVQNTSEWQAKAIQGEDLYAAKIQDAIANRSRAKGIQNVSDSEWKSAAVNKGAQRIGPGMTASKDKFASGISEVLSTIQSVNLPPKTADPIANVQNRVVPIVSALADMKRRK